MVPNHEMPRVEARSQNGLDGLKNLALRQWDVQGNIRWPLAEVVIRHVFHNTGPEVLEVVYSFPLSSDMTLEKFRVVFQDHVVESQVVDRQEAQTTYEKAVEEGDFAVKLEQHRSNAYSLNIGNLAPDERVLVEFRLLQYLEARGGRTTIRIPTVIGPRYIPGEPVDFGDGLGWAFPTDAVPDADKITPPVSPDGVPYTVRAAFRIEGSMPIRKIESSSHPFAIEMVETNVYTAVMGDHLKPNKDIVLSITWEAAREAQLWPLEYRDNPFVALSLWGDAALPQRSQPLAVTFLVDVSGSMSGSKLETTKKALRLCLRKLLPGERFRFIAFESNFYPWPTDGSWLTLDDVNLHQADTWIEHLESMGGTELLPALNHALRGWEEDSRDGVVVLLTDGQVGNERQIVEQIQRSGFRGRMLLFGIDTAVNQDLFQRIQQVIPATTEFIFPGEDLNRAVNLQFQGLRYPWIRELELVTDGGTIPLTDMFTQLPFPLEPGTHRLIFMEWPAVPNSVRALRAVLYNDALEFPVHLVSPKDEFKSRLLKYWANQMVQWLENNSGVEKQWHQISAKDLALAFELPSSHTAWVATYQRTEKVEQAPTVQVIPVEPPEQWEMPMEFYHVDGSVVGDRDVLYSMQPLHRFYDANLKAPVDILSDIWLRQRADGALTPSRFAKTPVMSTIVFLWWLLSRYSLRELLPYQFNLQKALDFLNGKSQQFSPKEQMLWHAFLHRFSKMLRSQFQLDVKTYSSTGFSEESLNTVADAIQQTLPTDVDSVGHFKAVIKSIHRLVKRQVKNVASQ